MYMELLKEMERLGYNSYMIERAKERIIELQKRGVQGVDKFVKKLRDRLNEKEDYLDILMEGRFAIILARNKFSNIHIEYCQEGPDLKANWNRNTVYFEVTRKRPSEDDRIIQSSAAFVSPATTENIIDKIRVKIPQLQTNGVNIVVIWSDTITLGKPELEKAFESIRDEIKETPEEYKKLSGVLLTNGGYNSGTLKQFYLFENDNASKPLSPRLTRKLNSLHEQNLEKLQGYWE